MAKALDSFIKKCYTSHVVKVKNLEIKMNIEKWEVWEQKKIEVTQDDLSRLLMGIELLFTGKRLTSKEQKDTWELLHNRIQKLIEPEPPNEW